MYAYGKKLKKNVCKKCMQKLKKNVCIWQSDLLTYAGKNLKKNLCINFFSSFKRQCSFGSNIDMHGYRYIGIRT